MLFNHHAKRAHAPMTEAARREALGREPLGREPPGREAPGREAIQREALERAKQRMERTRAKGWVRQQAFVDNLAFLIRHDPLFNNVPASLRTKITLLLNTVASEPPSECQGGR